MALSETGGCHRQLASPQLGARSPEVDLTTEASQGTGWTRFQLWKGAVDIKDIHNCRPPRLHTASGTATTVYHGPNVVWLWWPGTRRHRFVVTPLVSRHIGACFHHNEESTAFDHLTPRCP